MCGAEGETPKIHYPQKKQGFCKRNDHSRNDIQKVLVYKNMTFVLKRDHLMKSINDGFYHTWASHCVVGVSKDSGTRVGKGSGMVDEWVSSHFMAKHV